MPKPIALVLHGHDNDSYMLRHSTNLARCAVCGELLERPKLNPEFTINKKRDVSATYDGYTIVSKKFVNEWEGNGGIGLNFTPIPNEPGYFIIDAEHVVEFDWERRKTRFEKQMPCCKQFHSVVGATPAFLRSPECLSNAQAVRTDLRFGSGDDKHPLIIIPLEIGNALKRARLSGLDFSDVWK